MRDGAKIVAKSSKKAYLYLFVEDPDKLSKGPKTAFMSEKWWKEKGDCAVELYDKAKAQVKISPGGIFV